MRVLRTPDERFADLAGFPYEPRYVTVSDGLRMAYVEAGPAGGEPVLLLHGEPTWSYVYRAVIPVLAGAGLRVIAPDLIGFGRSDKPSEVTDHSYARQVEWTRSFAYDALDLRGVTIVGHDWGGLIGLRLATEHPDRVARMVATNTGLPTGDQQMPEVWLRFREAVRTTPALDVPRLVRSGCRSTLAPGTLAAYDAPFPDETFKAAPRAMPDLVPTTPDDPASAANRTAWQRLSTWDKPFLVAFSDSDPITSAMAPVLHRIVPGAETVSIAGAGHFVQEDAGGELGAAIVRFVTGGLIDRYVTASAEFERRLRAVRDDQWSWPTPCTEWDVRALVNHMTQANANYVRLQRGGTSAEFLRFRDADALGDDPVGAYTRSVRDCAAAFADPGALDRILDHPLGRMTGRQGLAVRTTDSAIHAWDLARAVGADEHLDGGLVTWVADHLEETYEGLPEMPTSAQTTHRFFAAPDGVLPADASTQDRLLHRTGRSPVSPAPR